MNFMANFLYPLLFFVWVSPSSQDILFPNNQHYEAEWQNTLDSFSSIETLVKQITLMDWNYCDMLNMLGDMKY